MRLPSKRYNEIKRTVADLFEDYDVRTIPIDVFGLAEKMGIEIVYASECSPDHLRDYFDNVESFVAYYDVSQKYVVYLDDVNTGEKRQKFSLAHEIIHIVLNHKDQSEYNESEANFGAAYLLCPTSLAILSSTEELMISTKGIQSIFDMSLGLAEIAARQNKRRLANVRWGPADYESRINSLLKESLFARIHGFVNKNPCHS